MNHNGIAIALAWPETLCKQPGSWYDPLLRYLGFNQEHYYKVGHAALVLVNIKTRHCHYLDFGRYHASFGFGRVRDAETDHDLEIITKAEINETGHLVNLNAILDILVQNESCHGLGPIHASTIPVSFECAYQQAKQLQQRGQIPYGPFIWYGTNCSRFVRTVLLAGNPPYSAYWKLKFPITISPTPLGIVNSICSQCIPKWTAAGNPILNASKTQYAKPIQSQ